jgi:excisionase family DNA binding protein
VQKLTVREAAENLGISEDAVRKRIQRGTLAHHKASDGYVYVYMDNNSGAQQETSVEEISATNQDSRPSWWDYAAGASALLLVTSGLIYVLGLFTLWMPMSMTNTDYLTAWHAASLVPKTVVAGLGVQQLVAFPLLAGTFIFIILFALHKLGGARWGLLAAWLVLYLLVIGFSVWRIATDTSSLSNYDIMAVVVIFAPVYSGVIFEFVRRLSGSKYGTGTWNRLQTSVHLAYMLVFISSSTVGALYYITSEESIGYLIDAAIIVGAGTIVWLGGIAAVGVLIETFTPSVTPSVPLRRGLLASYFIVLVTAFIAAFMLTIPSRPPLPSVEIDVKGKGKGAVNGKLLTHSDGFWHVFQPQESRVTAVPDDEVMRVWVSKAQ